MDICLWKWSLEELQFVRAAQWARVGGSCGDVCICVFSVSLCHSVQLDVVFCDHLAFLADKITHKQMWNSFYAQIVSLICTSITLKQIHIFKISFLAELAVVYFILELSLFSFLSFHRYWFLNLYLLSPYQIDFSYSELPPEARTQPEILVLLVVTHEAVSSLVEGSQSVSVSSPCPLPFTGCQALCRRRENW